MLDPVVVKPDTVSKNASIKPGISFVMTKGSAPTSDMMSQPRATAIKPSFA